RKRRKQETSSITFVRPEFAAALHINLFVSKSSLQDFSSELQRRHRASECSHCRPLTGSVRSRLCTLTLCVTRARYTTLLSDAAQMSDFHSFTLTSPGPGPGPGPGPDLDLDLDLELELDLDQTWT
ncbi:hypothetical protein INR49_011961, partial [Caranx melampygus]